MEISDLLAGTIGTFLIVASFAIGWPRLAGIVVGYWTFKFKMGHKQGEEAARADYHKQTT